MNCQISDVVVS
ncbi:hypothetical protein BOH78_4871 [Pichia kudriavzevii]|nr:hypothetical protein BOH78_4871 [Pichia kudriavzevii]